MGKSKNLRILFPIAVLVTLTFFSLIFPGRNTDPDSSQIMGTLTDVTSIADYFSKLVTLRTLDFQPLRDLTLLIDLAIYKSTDFYSFVFQNVLWWIAGCFVTFKIFESVQKKLEFQEILILTLLFSIYPLHSYIVSWGMARKHLMSFFFISLATLELIRPSPRSTFKLCVYYLLAMLSHPIGILWPLWAAAHIWLHRPQDLKSHRLTFAILGITLISTAVINQIYYTNSVVFLSVYPPKTSDFFNFQSQLLAFGHYTWTIFFPYWPSMYYTLGSWTTLAGMTLATILVALCFKFKNKEILTWGLFALFPLLPVLLSPEMIQNTYCLLPLLGVFTALAVTADKWHHLGKKVLLAMVPVFAVVTFFQASAWKSPRLLLKASFENAPNCLIANNHLRTELGAGRDPDKAILSYFKNHDCFATTIRNQSNLLKAQLLQSRILYYDDTIPMAERAESLKVGVKTQNLFALIYLTALYIKYEAPETEAHLKELILWLKKNSAFYEVAIAKKILPACRSMKDMDCKELERFAVLPEEKFGLILNE